MATAGKYDNVLIQILTYYVTPEEGLEEGSEGYDTHKWLKDLQDTETYNLNPFQKKHTQTRQFRGNKVVCALRECLVNHRWGRGFELIRYLIKHQDATANIVFKVGLELCHQQDPGRGRLLEQLLMQLRVFYVLRKYDLHMEYIFFLLTQKDAKALIQDALDMFKTYKKQIPAHNNATDSWKRLDHEHRLLESYRGLLFYAQWLITKKNIDKSCDSDAEMNVIEEVEMAHEETTLQVLSDRALASLKVIEGQAGVWDIFIAKYVQLVEHRGWHDEAERMLKVYAEKNPENPNAHRYLLKHYQGRGNEEKAYLILKMLAKLLPSEPLVLDLYELHRKNGEGPLQTLPLLFNLLDYSCWINSLKPWNLLAQELLVILRQDYNDDAALAIQNCYSPRLSWWPPYHFNVHSARLDDGPSTVSLETSPREPREATAPGAETFGDDDWQSSQWNEIPLGQRGSARVDNPALDGGDDVGPEYQLQVLVYKAAIATMLNTGGGFVAAVKQLIRGNSDHVDFLREAAEASSKLEISSPP